MGAVNAILDNDTMKCTVLSMARLLFQNNYMMNLYIDKQHFIEEAIAQVRDVDLAAMIK